MCSRLVAQPRRRVAGVNLVTALMAGLVVQRFEGTSRSSALAALMPIVAAWAATPARRPSPSSSVQGLARAVARCPLLVLREMGVGALNGLVMSGILARSRWQWWVHGNRGHHCACDDDNLLASAFVA